MREYPAVPTPTESGRLPVPPLIRPNLAPYRIDVLFWGLRALRIKDPSRVQKPRIEIEIGGRVLRQVARWCLFSIYHQVFRSDSIVDLQKNQNFPSQVKCIDVVSE